MALHPRVVQWEPLVRKYAAENGVPADLALSMLQRESAGKPDARSGSGARGLMQLMPIAVKDMGLDPTTFNYEDPETNIRTGVGYLAKLLGRFKGDEKLATAAYNAGPTLVARMGKVPGNVETQNYVKAIGDTLAGIRGVDPSQGAFRILGDNPDRARLARELSESKGLRAACDAGRAVEPGREVLLAKSGRRRRGESA